MIYVFGGPTWIHCEMLEFDADGKPTKFTQRSMPTKVIVTAVTASTMTVALAERKQPARNYGPPKRKRW